MRRFLRKQCRLASRRARNPSATADDSFPQTGRYSIHDAPFAGSIVPGDRHGYKAFPGRLYSRDSALGLGRSIGRSFSRNSFPYMRTSCRGSLNEMRLENETADIKFMFQTFWKLVCRKEIQCPSHTGPGRWNLVSSAVRFCVQGSDASESRWKFQDTFRPHLHCNMKAFASSRDRA